MNYLARIRSFGTMVVAVSCWTVIALVGMTNFAQAQVDNFGAIDRLYIDSVSAGPGQSVIVGFNMINDEPISSVSVPVTYDPALLTLTAVSFAGSRLDYMSNKFMTPSLLDTVNGHFFVSTFTLFEDPVPPGDGLLFTATFTINAEATIGTTVSIDTLFYPPGGNMIYVEASTAATIVPEVIGGAVTIGENNSPPVISPLAGQTVFEGDTLVVTVIAEDAEKDNLIINCTEKPSGAIFTDNQDGSAQLRWVPAFTGPTSSDGSPFALTFLASDGLNVSSLSLPVNVINKNRKPELSIIASYEFPSGALVELPLSTVEPDFEPLTWSITGLPEAAVFTPEGITWATELIDTGLFPITLIAADPQGYADTAFTTVHLTPTSLYTLSIDTVDGFPGDNVALTVSLANSFAVTSFDLLLYLDPSVLSVTDIVSSGGRISDFEYFTTSFNDGGLIGTIRINAIGNPTDITGKALPAGSGEILTLGCRISGDLSFSGTLAPARFMFADNVTKNDNTMTDSLGSKIEQSAIEYIDGGVFVLSYGTVTIGDINLNGIAYDIGDPIYFINYFINPYLYPLNPLQMANSDINGDNALGTVGDLVALIQIISNGGFDGGKVNAPESEIVKTSLHDAMLSIDSDEEVGAVLAVFKKYDGFAEADILNLTDRMDISSAVVDDEIRVIVYNLDGETIPSGLQQVIAINDAAELLSLEVASARGALLTVERAPKEAVIPESFALHQNYPNPFNPETTIEFDLPAATEVRLVIYNMLGERVKVLIDAHYPAGAHEVRWDSRDVDGDMVASGVYLYRLETNTVQQTRKMLLLK